MKRLTLIGMTVVSWTLLAAAAEVREAAFEGCSVTYHRGHAALARDVGRSVGAILRELNAELGVHLSAPVKVRLTVDAAEFRRRIGPRTPEWSLAVARLERNEIVVRADQLNLGHLNAVMPMLRHELCHLALHTVERRRRRRLPLWFHEGVACHVSGVSLFKDWRAFDVAGAQGTLLPLAALAEQFPKDAASARLAYLQSEDFLRFVTRERSKDAIRWILDAFRRSGHFEDAVGQAVGESLASLESRWRNRHRSRFPWLRAFWEATTLFTVLAVATVIIYYVHRARVRRRRREWDQEDWRLGEYLHRAEQEYEDEETDDPWA